RFWFPFLSPFVRLRHPSGCSVLVRTFRTYYHKSNRNRSINQVPFHKKEGTMPKKTMGSLGIILKTRRSSRGLREVALEIGIGPATLMRVENGHVPDVTTFGKVCKW